MKLKKFILAVVMMLAAYSVNAQCSFRNTAFKSGEFLSYNLYYNWKFVWVKVGTASMYTVQSRYNGKWDTGDFEKNIQPEEVYYFSEKLECRAKWDLTETWNPKAKELYKQKPADIKKQKGDKKKTIKRRNMERARELGIEYIPR